MEKNKILQMLIPALAGAALLGLVLFLVLGPKEPITTPTTEKGPDGANRNMAITPESQRTTERSTDKLSQTMPPIDVPEFKDIGGGLKMMDVVEGNGDPCPYGATITAHYAGWLASNGTKFDSSYLDGKAPLVYALGQLIPGWQKGLPGMKPGGVRRLIIPSELGYGARGSPDKIPGGATLVFEFKLLEWK